MVDSMLRAPETALVTVSSQVHQTRESEPYHLQVGFIMKTSFPLLLENQSLVNRKKFPHFLGCCVRLRF